MPHVPQDVLDRINALEREVKHLRGRAHIRPAQNQILNGSVKIGEGGSFEVRAPTDAQVLGVGRFSTGRYGVSMAREDGTGVAFEVGGNATSSEQMIRMFARSGYPNPIVMDDAHADGFLGRPFVPIPLSTGVDVDSSTERTTHFGMAQIQHRILQASVNVWAPANTTITVRLRLGHATGYEDIGDAITVAGGASGQEVANTQRIKIDRAHSERWRLLIRASRTAGTGVGIVYPYGLWGVNTQSADEA